MSKMNDLQITLDSIEICGKELVRAVNVLRACFSGQDGPETPEKAPAAAEHIPVAEPAEPGTYTFTDLRSAFAAKAHDGFAAPIKQLLRKYGAEKLSELREADYQAAMADLEALE